MTIRLTLLCITLITSVTAQKYTFTATGTSAKQESEGAEFTQFESNGDSYFITKVKVSQALPQYHLECYDSTGKTVAENRIVIDEGFFNASFVMKQHLVLGNKVYAIIEHESKADGTTTYLAREMDRKGKVSEKEVLLTSKPFGKMMNSGNQTAVVSNNREYLAAFSELPYMKEQTQEIKLSLFDKELNKVASLEYALPGESVKKQYFNVQVANDGTIYIVREQVKKGNSSFSVFQFDLRNPGAPKEYTIVAPEELEIFDYQVRVNQLNELVFCGAYYGKVDSKKVMGNVFFTNKNKSEQITTISQFDEYVTQFRFRNLLLSEDAVFMVAERAYSEMILANAQTGEKGGTRYSNKNIYVVGFDLSGNKKFQMKIERDLSTREVDYEQRVGSAVLDGKLTLVFNDLRSKYLKDDHSNLVPVLAQFSIEGQRELPMAFGDKSVLPADYYVYPSTVMFPTSKELGLIARSLNYSVFVKIKAK